jgi:hypothetical protein
VSQISYYVRQNLCVFVPSECIPILRSTSTMIGLVKSSDRPTKVISQEYSSASSVS